MASLKYASNWTATKPHVYHFGDTPKNNSDIFLDPTNKRLTITRQIIWMPPVGSSGMQVQCHWGDAVIIANSIISDVTIGKNPDGSSQHADGINLEGWNDDQPNTNPMNHFALVTQCGFMSLPAGVPIMLIVKNFRYLELSHLWASQTVHPLLIGTGVMEEVVINQVMCPVLIDGAKIKLLRVAGPMPTITKSSKIDAIKAY